MPVESAVASVESLLHFLDDSPSPFHAVASSKALLDRAGFVELHEAESWQPTTIIEPRSEPRSEFRSEFRSGEAADVMPTDGNRTTENMGHINANDKTGESSGIGGNDRFYVIRGGAIIAWTCNKAEPITGGLRIIGAHTDSPNLRIKPNPDVASNGWRQWGVEVYGGTLNNSWLDRDLGLSGRVVLSDGSTRLVKFDEPLARVAQLAIHIDREVNEKGLVLDKQLHLTPIVGLGTKSDSMTFKNFLSARITCDPLDISGWDLMLHDLTPARQIGIGGEFIASARIDNLFSAWAAIRALIDTSENQQNPQNPPGPRSASQPMKHIAIAALFDHEEVGSASTTGAAGPFLQTTIDRILEIHNIFSMQDRARTFAASSCVSADMAHAVHPNYPDRHEPDHRPLPNAGPVIKVNANQRYATDAQTASMFQAAAKRVGVDCQTFVSRNSQPCGSTIGPITATQLGIRTVDVGCAMLSMHSARELCGAQDASVFRAVLASYLQQ